MLSNQYKTGNAATERMVVPSVYTAAPSVSPSYASAKVEASPAPVQKTDEEKTLWLNVSGLEDADIEELLETLIFYSGETKVWFVKNGKKMLCSQRVTPNKALMAEISSFLSENCIKLL